MLKEEFDRIQFNSESKVNNGIEIYKITHVDFENRTIYAKKNINSITTMIKLDQIKKVL